jgi:DNA-binding LytR/AlgR family response regulator
MKIAIIDDNKEVLKSIEELLKDSDYGLNEIKCYTNTSKIEKELIDESIDLLFIDIKLEDNNGVDFIKEHNNEFKNTNIVYITGYDEYIEKVFETDPLYVLKKPITKEKLLKVFNKIGEKQIPNYLLLKNGKEMCRIPLKEINYIESFGRIVEFHFDNNDKQSFYNNISLLIEMLPCNFVRSHKSYIVNLDKVKTFNKKEITLKNDIVIPISRLKYNEIKNKIMNYIKGK